MLDQANTGFLGKSQRKEQAVESIGDGASVFNYVQEESKVMPWGFFSKFQVATGPGRSHPGIPSSSALSDQSQNSFFPRQNEATGPPDTQCNSGKL